MCGIAGYISLKNNITADHLKKASALLHHRGPDAEGFYFSADEKVGFAHRRLSIIDLSDTANQPMFTADGRYCIIFNGEIYNFQDLKNTLKDKGASLRTNSDTEVILELFAQIGNECFSKLNGMFALVIYDRQKQTITFSRDHAGIKPLFYYLDEADLIFASELKVIREIKGKSLTINDSAIPYFLHLGYIPEPLTIYNNVYKFPSASYWTISLQLSSLAGTNSAIQHFWTPEEKILSNPIKDEVSAKKELKTLLTDAVQKQMVSDVPIGTFLSGGVDSSLVTAIAAAVSPNKISSYSIAIDDGKFNESKYASAVAANIGTDYHEFHVTEKDIISLIDQFLPAYDEPYADSSAFPTMLVSKLARKYVTVTLSGDGGDELFMGYGFYRWAKRLSNPAIPVVRWPLYAASKLMSDRYERAGQLFAYQSEHNLPSHIFSTEQGYFSESELYRLLPSLTFNFFALNELGVTQRKLSMPEKQSAWDLKTYLKDELLVKVDRASMQFSLETRVPILDYRIIEFSLNLDEKLKINKQGVMKYLLKEVLYDYLPKDLFQRPKWGFRIPLEKWMRNDLRYLVDKYTSSSILQKYQYVNEVEVERLKKAYFGGKDYLYSRLWLIVVLHWWLEHNESVSGNKVNSH